MSVNNSAENSSFVNIPTVKSLYELAQTAFVKM